MDRDHQYVTQQHETAITILSTGRLIFTLEDDELVWLPEVYDELKAAGMNPDALFPRGTLGAQR